MQATATENAQATILVADTLSESGLIALREAGCQVRSQPELNPDTLAEAVKAYDPDVLIVRSTKVPAAVFTASNRLSLVIRAGAGYDTIDIKAASARGISVANCPGMNAIAVAELTWGLILACDRNIPAQSADLLRGVWAKKAWSNAEGLCGRTLGIIGTGRIGREVAARGQGFGMKVVGWSRSLTQSQADAMDIGFCSSLQNLLKMSHCRGVVGWYNPECAIIALAQDFSPFRQNFAAINHRSSRINQVDQCIDPFLPFAMELH